MNSHELKAELIDLEPRAGELRAGLDGQKAGDIARRDVVHTCRSEVQLGGVVLGSWDSRARRN